MSNELSELPEAIKQNNRIWVRRIAEENNGTAIGPFTEALRAKMEGHLSAGDPNSLKPDDVAMIGEIAQHADLDKIPERYRTLVAKARHAHTHDGLY